MSQHYDQLGNLDNLAVGLNAELGDPWHGHGAFANAVPLDAALRVLTVHADVTPLFVIDIDSPMGFRQLDNAHAVVDTDTGHVFQAGVSDGYRVYLYEDLMQLVSDLIEVGAGDVEIGCAMALGHKEQAMVQVRPPQGITVGGDRILPWIAAYSSLNSTWATGVKACRTRLVCDNTGRMVMGEDTPTFKVKHTKNASVRLGAAREALGIMWESIPAMAAEVERLQNTTLTDGQFRQTLAKLYPLTGPDGGSLAQRAVTIANGKRETVAGLWANDPRVGDYRGTAYGAIQAVNTAFTHNFTVRGTASGITRTDRQAINTVSGKVDQVDAMTIAAINAVFAEMGMASVA